MRKNILFIVVDQFRADLLFGALANHVPLPNMRGLMAEAVSFRQHFSVLSPCGPSRASLLTGQYGMNHRAVRNGTPLAHDTPNLATELRAAGYLPQLYGYTDISRDPRMHDPNDPAMKSYEQVLPGFDEVLEMRLEESWPWRAHLLAKGYEVPPGMDIFRPAGTRPDDPALYAEEDSDTAFLTDRLLADIAARPPGWCAHVTYIRPHPPLVAPAPWNRLVDPSTLPGPHRPLDRDAMAAMHPLHALALSGQGIAGTVEGFSDLEDNDDNARMLRAIYLGLAAEVDHHLGRIFGQLKAAGQWNETLIVLTADHGELLGDHHLWGKMTWHDAAFHVPLVIRDPSRPVGFGTAIDQPTESVDVMPTLLDLAGGTVPDTVDGYSLGPFLDDQPPDDWRGYSYSELDFGNPVAPGPVQARLGLTQGQANLAVLRDATHMLVHVNGGLPPLLLRRGDEATNLAADPAEQPRLLAMTRAMLDHRMRYVQGRFARTLITADGPRRGTPR